MGVVEQPLQKGAGMIHVCYEISKEEYEKAKDDPKSIIGDDIKIGYGCYLAKVEEINGKYYLSYDRGESCD